MLFNGDSLLIRGCGRTDLQLGDPEILYEIITQKLYSYPDDTLVYPSHDYLGRTAHVSEKKKLLIPELAADKRWINLSKL